MDQKPKTAATNPEPLQPHPPNRWLNRTKTFLDVPNPRIVRTFRISSFATFCSGVGFVFEWAFHGKNHTGFQWIIYYGLSLIFLPVLIFLGFGIVIAVSSRHDSRQAVSSAVEEEQPVNVSAGEGGNEETDGNIYRSLAVVVDPDNKKCSGRTFEDKASKLKRTVSFPLHSQVRSCRTR